VATYCQQSDIRHFQSCFLSFFLYCFLAVVLYEVLKWKGGLSCTNSLLSSSSWHMTLKQQQQVSFCAVLRFTLFFYYLFTWWFVHAHALLGLLAVCTGTTNNTLPPCKYRTQINWTLLHDEKNMKMAHRGWSMLFWRTIQPYCYKYYIPYIIIVKGGLCKITCPFCLSLQSVTCIGWATECHAFFMRIVWKNIMQMIWGHFVGYV